MSFTEALMVKPSSFVILCLDSMIFFHFYLRRLWLVKLSSFRRRCLPRINVFCFARDMISCVARSCVHVAGCWPKLMTLNLRRPSQLWWVLQRCYALLDLDLLDKSMSVMSEQIFHLQMHVYKRVYWFFSQVFSTSNMRAHYSIIFFSLDSLFEL